MGRWIVAALVLVAGVSSAQESLRNSMAGDAAAAAQRQQIGSQPYTYKAGDFRLLVVPSVELQYNDNVNLSKTNTESDFILRPLLQLTGSYPVTQHNLLSFNVGVGWDEYLEHSQFSAFRLLSDSLLSFDVHIKDVWINFHDRMSASQDPAAEPALTGTARYGTFNNAAGLTTTWDLEDLILTLGYDHANYLSLTKQYSYLNRSSELPVARAGFQFDSRLTAGIEGSASYTTYDQNVLNDNQSYSGGLYADWKPGPYFDVQPRAGYVVYELQHTSRSIPPHFYFGIPPTVESIQTSDVNTWYADLTVSHQATRAISYGLSGGHEIRPGIESDLIEDSYFRPSVNWTIIRDMTLNTSLFYEHGSQGAGNVSGNLSETYDWYGGALALSYPVMKNLLVSLNYRLTFRSSDIAEQEYAQNVAGIKFSYQWQ